jgi:biofilm protein TabA
LGDYWHQTIAEADEACLQLYGINDKDWVDIGDPLEGCQQDWIAPVRVKGRNIGNPQWGIFERLEQDGVWREFLHESHGSRTSSSSGKESG